MKEKEIIDLKEEVRTNLKFTGMVLIGFFFSFVVTLIICFIGFLGFHREDAFSTAGLNGIYLNKYDVFSSTPIQGKKFVEQLEEEHPEITTDKELFNLLSNIKGASLNGEQLKEQNGFIVYSLTGTSNPEWNRNYIIFGEKAEDVKYGMFYYTADGTLNGKGTAHIYKIWAIKKADWRVEVKGIGLKLKELITGKDTSKEFKEWFLNPNDG